METPRFSQRQGTNGGLTGRLALVGLEGSAHHVTLDSVEGVVNRGPQQAGQHEAQGASSHRKMLKETYVLKIDLYIGWKRKIVKKMFFVGWKRVWAEKMVVFGECVQIDLIPISHPNL